MDNMDFPLPLQYLKKSYSSNDKCVGNNSSARVAYFEIGSQHSKSGG